MKRFRLLNSEDGFIVDEVDARVCKFCNSAYIYKDENGYFNLVDIDSGLPIIRCNKLKQLEEIFISTDRKPTRKEAYEDYRKTDAYKIKVERFEKLILAFNYKKGH